MEQTTDAGLPVPPQNLRLRVSGDGDVDKFLGTGRLLYADIKRTAILGGKPLPECRDILDFGCGVGRVSRFFPRQPGFVGVDIDREAIDWASSHLGAVGTFRSGPDHPPLPFPDGTFDLIFSVSVWTHLNADMGDEWMREMRRLLRPDGLLIVTFLGDDVMQSVWPDGAAVLNTDGIAFLATKTDGLPDFYGLTFHTQAFVSRRWHQLWNMTGYYPKSIGMLQDAATFRPLRSD